MYNITCLCLWRPWLISDAPRTRLNPGKPARMATVPRSRSTPSRPRLPRRVISICNHYLRLFATIVRGLPKVANGDQMNAPAAPAAATASFSLDPTILNTRILTREHREIKDMDQWQKTDLFFVGFSLSWLRRILPVLIYRYVCK